MELGNRNPYRAIFKGNTVAGSMKKTGWFITWKMVVSTLYIAKVIMEIDNAVPYLLAGIPCFTRYSSFFVSIL